MIVDKNYWNKFNRNVIEYAYYFDMFAGLAMTQFEWDGLPETVDSRFLEATLLYNGKAAFFNDDVMGYVALRAVFGGEFNQFFNPTEFTAYGANGYTRMLTDKNAVPIYDTYNRMPLIAYIDMYAKRLYDIDQTIDINIRTQKTPVVGVCDPSTKLSMENFMQKYTGNELCILVNKSFNPADSFKTFNMGHEYVADKLFQARANILAELYTVLGIENVPYEKKERLTNDEISMNNGGTNNFRNIRLKAREQAAKQINKMFPDLNVSVKYIGNDENVTEEYKDNYEEYIERDDG